MNRWPKAPIAHLFIAASAVLVSATAIFPTNSWAQMQRIFPMNVERGVIKFSEIPLEVKLNGTEERLAPGARIRGPMNTFVLNNALGGGVTRSLAVDKHGKTLGMALLEMDI